MRIGRARPARTFSDRTPKKYSNFFTLPHVVFYESRAT
jgi:hypothetical protein